MEWVKHSKVFVKKLNIKLVQLTRYIPMFKKKQDIYQNICTYLSDIGEMFLIATAGLWKRKARPARSVEG